MINMTLNKLQKSQIKAWMQEESYGAVNQFLGERLNEIGNQEITGSNEFETLKALHQKQGSIQALRDFFNDLDKQAYD